MDVGFLSLQSWRQGTSERTCTTITLSMNGSTHQTCTSAGSSLWQTQRETQTESSSGIKLYLRITEQISQTHGVIFGVSSAGQGVGLDDPDGFLPTHYAL